MQQHLLKYTLSHTVVFVFQSHKYVVLFLNGMILWKMLVNKMCFVFLKLRTESGLEEFNDSGRKVCLIISLLIYHLQNFAEKNSDPEEYKTWLQKWNI